MILKIFKRTAFLIAFLPVVIFAQETKLPFSLAKITAEQKLQNKNIEVLIKGDIEEIKKEIKLNRGVFKYSAGDIASVSIPLSSIGKLAANGKIQRIEDSYHKPVLLSDTMARNSNIDSVHAGAFPLVQPYTGKDVVVGVIDTGIDFTHPDFKDSTGKSRVRFLWDQTLADSANTPAPYNYGQEWNNLQIDSGKCTHKDPDQFYGHGTGVAGIAAGNGLAVNKYAGSAPGSEIIFVAVDFYNATDPVIVDAVNYIYKKADAMGMPCVINLSLGDYYGSHDGKDLQAQLIDAMITQKKGRSLVAAAGNAGGYPFHLSYPVTADTNFTWFTSGGDIYFQLWADTADFKNVQFAIGADAVSPEFSFRGRTNFNKIQPFISNYTVDTLYKGSNRIGLIQQYAQVQGNSYGMTWNIKPDSIGYYWRLITTGSGDFDLWSFDVVFSGLPDSATFPDIVKYKYPDTEQTMVSSFQCLDNVITVANYINRKTWYDYNNNLYVDSAAVPGAITGSSSKGYTRDGRVKPDIAAPGASTFAPIRASYLPTQIATAPQFLAKEGMHFLFGGTSAASPSVAGIAALYLEKCPGASAIEIKNAIINNAKADAYTGAVPNNTWGYGKVNAFAALSNTSCLSTYLNSTENSGLCNTAYPNPFSEETIICYDLNNQKGKGEIKIYNVLGQEIKNMEVTGNKGEITFKKENLNPGIYFYTLLMNGKKIISEKLIIL